jgi:hypothetical protein
MITGRNTIHQYLHFVARNAKDYRKFNKQLVIGELAGFIAGLLVAEFAAVVNFDGWLISILSSLADYSASMSGFFVIFYYDNKSSYIELNSLVRIKRISGMALALWPSVLAADIVSLLVMSYIQHLLLGNNLDVGITSALAHFLAFGVFNLTAILSKSIFDFYYCYNRAKSGR